MLYQLRELVVLITLTDISIFLTLGGMDNNMLLRVVIGLLLVLILPGAALTAAIFSGHTLRIEKRILYTIGLSLSTTILSGLILNLTPLGLQDVTWVAILSAVTLIATAVALFRARERLASKTRPTWPPVRLGLREVGLFGLGGAVILLAIGLARMPASEQGLQGYSTLYLVPSNDGNPNDVRVGVSSDEFAATTFQLQLKINGKVVHEWNGLALKPGENWDAVLQLPNQPGTGRVEAVLYRLDSPTVVYRHVLLVHNGTSG